MTIPVAYNGYIWTQERIWEMSGLLARGWSKAAIARHFNTTEIAVHRARQRAGLAAPTKQHYSGLAVSRLLGFPSATTNRWIQRGWIRARKIRMGRYGTWRVTYDALVDFIENPMYWNHWQPEQVADRGLRFVAYRAREGE